MALINTDWTKELGQLKTAVGEIVDTQLSPMVQGAIAQAGQELSQVVSAAGRQVEANIKVLSEEIHNQRSLTKEELYAVIDYAAGKLASTVDERLALARAEASALVTEQVQQLKREAEGVAICGLSLAAAVAVAAFELIYRRLSPGGLDAVGVAQVLLLAAAVGVGIWGVLKLLARARTPRRSS